MTVYGAGATRDGAGWFFGLTGPQVALVLAAAFPCWLAMATGSWVLLLGLVPMWCLTAGLICVPIRGFSAIQWLGVVLRSAIGGALGWTKFQSRATAGTAESATLPDDLDLPGVLAAVQIHDGPPMAGRVVRPAVIQQHSTRTWAATGRLAHPGIGMRDEADRAVMAAGLSELMEASSTSSDIAAIALQVRTVPDDGVERADWVRRHAKAEPELSQRLHAQLEELTAGAAVRTEAFITVVLREAAISKIARRAGGGIDGRSRILFGHLEEVEARLTGAIGCSHVEWLDTSGLARVIRTGFEPGDAALLSGPSAPDVPLALAGPTLASTALRSYQHGDWSSASSTIQLPRKGALMGALARALVPSQPGERRALTVMFEPVSRTVAERSTGRAGMSAAMAAEMRRKVGKVERAKDRNAADRVRLTDEKLERGRALVRISSAISVTVPRQWSIHEYARRLDSSIRLCGFVPLPLDGAHDAAFVAATIPLGIGLPRHRR